MRTDQLDILTSHVRNRFFGKYRGEVVSNDDPARLGRLQVTVDGILDSESVWAWPCVPYAGKGVGFYSLPQQGDGVWIEFEGGNPWSPIWVGCFWKEGQVPEEATSSSVRIWKTPKVTIRIDDAAGALLIQTGETMKISMTGPGGIETSLRDTVKHTVSSSGVTSASGGIGNVAVTPAGTNVNNGGLEVL
jgi:uncharacterized protein involved in type VI secretion and phage assembly